MLKKSFILLFLLCTAFLFWVISSSSNLLTKPKEQPKISPYIEVPVTQENIDVCTDDQDCIIVPFSSCCGSTKKAINKKNKVIYDSHPEWQKMNDKSICNVIGMCAPDVHVNKTVCEESDSLKRCKLKY